MAHRGGWETRLLKGPGNSAPGTELFIPVGCDLNSEPGEAGDEAGEGTTVSNETWARQAAERRRGPEMAKRTVPPVPELQPLRVP